MNNRVQKIDRILKDIESLRGMIRKKSSYLQQIDLPYHLKFIALMTGVSIISFSLWMFFLLKTFIEFEKIPLYLKTLYFTLVSVITILIGFFKSKSLASGAKQIDEKYRFFSIFKEFLAIPELKHSYLLWLLTVVVFLPLLTFHFGSAIILPLLGLLFGVICVFLGGIFSAKPYFFIGYWFLLSGMLPLFFPFLDICIMVAVTWGGGFLIFGLISWFRKKDVKKAR